MSTPKRGPSLRALLLVLCALVGWSHRSAALTPTGALPAATAAEPDSSAETAPAPTGSEAPASDDPDFETPPTPPPPPPLRAPAPPPAPEPVPVEPPPPPPVPAPPLEAPLVLGTPARIEVGGKTIYELHVVAQDRSPGDRALAGRKALSEAILTETPDSIRVEHGAAVAVIYAGKIPILQLTPGDAKVAGDSSLKVHADTVAVRIRNAISAEQKRSALATTVFSVSLAVLLTLIALYLLRRTSQLTEHARNWIITHREKIPALRVQSLEVIGPAAVRSSATLGVELAKWVGRIGVVYLWLLVTLSQFAATQGYVQKLTGTFVKPLTDMVQRVASALPLLGIGLVALGTVVLLVRFVDLFFASAARGETSIPYVSADVARPVGSLLQLTIVLCALLFAAPIVTGNTDGVFPRTGVVALGTLGLAATPLLASLVVGIGVIFSRHVKPGDFVNFGGQRGRVREIGLLSVRLEASAGVEVRVPQLLSLFHPTEIFGPLLRVAIELPIARLSPETTSALKRGALSVGTQPEIEVVRVDRDGALYRVSILTDRRDARSALFQSVSHELGLASVELGRSTPESGPS